MDEEVSWQTLKFATAIIGGDNMLPQAADGQPLYIPKSDNDNRRVIASSSSSHNK